jgi:TATA-binding protein-associated factor
LLLGRVLPYLQSKSWDTRIAAAKAIGGIITNQEQFDPNADDTDAKLDDVKSENGTDQTELPQSTFNRDDQLHLSELDLSLILQHGKKLLGSGSKESEYALAGLTPSERLARQKKTLFDRLGLHGEYIDDEMAAGAHFPAAPPPKGPPLPKLSKIDTKNISHPTGLAESALSPADTGSAVDESGLSKRQLNQLKRKNKNAAKLGANKMRVLDLAMRKTSEAGHTLPGPSPHPVKLNGNDDSSTDDSKPDYFSIKQEAADDDTKLVTEFKGEAQEEKPVIQPNETEAADWPFDVMCDFLANDLFDPNWEIRNGAAMGLREVLRVHGHGAGRHFGKSRRENDTANKAWLDDLACRLLCVLMLDRFGDYGKDTVVAPIRESVGQTLGALIAQVPETTAMEIYRILQKMISQADLDLKKPIWEVCHGGMIGLRYFVAIRKDLLLQSDNVIDGVIEAVTRGLAHQDDDVKSVSAATLVPIASELTTLRPHMLGSLISVVWDCLLDMEDDLSASTGAVMDLLANLCSYMQVLDAMKDNAEVDSDQTFDQLIPRLYPFFRHTITSVRLAVMKALATFLSLRQEDASGWIDWRLTRLLFQNLLLERDKAVLGKTFEVWQILVSVVQDQKGGKYATGMEKHVSPMLAAAIQPMGQARRPVALDTTLFIKPSGSPMTVSTSRKSELDQHARKKRRLDSEDPPQRETHNTDGHMIHGEVELVGEDVILRTRIRCANALGMLLPVLPPTQVVQSWSFLLQQLSSVNSTTVVFAAMIMEELAKNHGPRPDVTAAASRELQNIIESETAVWYFDILSSLQAARGQCQTLLAAFQNHAHVPRGKLPSLAVVCQGETGAGQNAFSITDAEKIVSTEFDRLIQSLTPAQRVAGVQYLNEARNNAKEVVEEARRIKDTRDMALRAATASILIALRDIPKKPGQLIKCIMDSVKAEEHEELQERSATSLVALIGYYLNSAKRGPADKLVSNIVKYSCVDTSETPIFELNSEFEDVVLSLRKEEDRKDPIEVARAAREAKDARIMRTGALMALSKLGQTYGGSVLEKLPGLKAVIEDPLRNELDKVAPSDLRLDVANGTALVDGLSVLRTIAPMLSPDLHPWELSLLPFLTKAMRSRISVVRYMAAKCFASICRILPVQAMTILVERVIPQISNPLDLHDRQGITECLYHLVQVLGDQILPYIIFLIVPVLGRMSDANDEVRLLATTSFATLVKLVPLESGIPDPEGMPESLLQGRERERKFMSQMLDPKKVESFQIPVAIKAELRPYQQDGVNWLAFLNKYNLHGVLCDDMGLGKTLQTLCIVASDHHMRAEEFSETKAPDKRRLPSLIVCPPSLSGHWQQEIKQFAPFLTCVAYVGNPAERSSRRQMLAEADIVITSYDVCRNDNSVLTPITWNYCVLDEGHLIKNPEAKITQAVKKLVCNHRLILSGTPIQNNVLELWSLFDFLMPGFLGTEKVFKDRFAKPIAASRNAKSSSKEQEAGALAVEALHKQVLPFLLRRLKEEVLNDLPPKILQNYYCDLSDLQKRLFEDFFKKEKKTVEASVGSTDKEAKQHIFQALQYMRKLCNSPALVVKEGNKQYDAVQKQLASTNSSLRDVAHAPKLSALRDLLVDCGIGVVPDANSNDISASNYVSPHRALIFCQMKEMLDMVQTEVLGKLLPSVQFLRLDGSVEATKRQNIVNKFNNDPSYDCLLLTTSVGGLGLNLTGADTVIFVEHDWNPQKDIQAMDRAHRIGQKKVVNVYRLITRGTLEEKILSLQRFKIDVASTVVNQQNAGLGSMETDQILDLFNLNEVSDAAADGNEATKDEDLVDVETGEVKKKGEKGWLNDVGELWDEKQYEEEFNLDSFVQNLQR